MKADMMGIGKTLQVISVISLQPRAHNNKVGNETHSFDGTGSFSEQSCHLSGFAANVSRVIGSVFTSNDHFDLYGEHDSSETDKDVENICFCKRSSMYEKFDISWIKCMCCKKNRHTNCCGFNSVEEVQDVSHFVCFSCICSKLYQSPPYFKPLAGTLIIVPSTLLSQWQQQIKEHTDGRLSVFVYSGIKAIERYVGDERFLTKKKLPPTSAVSPKKFGFAEKIDTFNDVHPMKLMTYDIVITTFEILKTELDRTISPYMAHDDFGLERTNFRKPKKFDIYPSPVTCLNWHRIVVDEAQEVQGAKTCTIFRMTMQLTGHHKWCVR